MKKRTMKQTTVTLAAAGFFTAVLAAEGGFTKLDCNDDGYISVIESVADETLHQSWARIDSNSDGKIDGVEFNAFEAKGSRHEEREVRPLN